jgi:hypothetical protein
MDPMADVVREMIREQKVKKFFGFEKGEEKVD